MRQSRPDPRGQPPACPAWIVPQHAGPFRLNLNSRDEFGPRHRILERDMVGLLRAATTKGNYYQ
jgi:hypothetical protein